MDGSRFDGLTRALGRRASRRSALAAAIAAVTGGLVLANDHTGAATCIASGATCGAVGCCAGLACDAKTKKCLGGPGATCKISSNCASGLKCKGGVCDGALVCRNLRESCVPAMSSCCGNLSCVGGKNVCLGMAGYAGCETNADCVSGLVCFAGTCQLQPTPTVAPPNPYGDAECDLIIEPGTDVGPLEDLDAGTTTCLAPGDHYFIERRLETDWYGGGGSIYGAANGSTVVHVKHTIEMNGAGVLANLTIIQSEDSYAPYIVRSYAGTGNPVLVSNVTIQASQSTALACFAGTTTVSNTTLTADRYALQVEGGAAILQNATMSGAETGVYITDGATVTMDAASKVTNNTGGADYGSAIYIEKPYFSDGGSFTNNGGTVSGNSSTGAFCDNDVLTYDWDEDYEPQCCTNAGNGKTGTCSIA